MFQLGERDYNDDDAAWDAFVAAHPHGSLLQTTHWARLKGRFGWTGYRVWLRRDGDLVAGAQLLFRSAVMRLVKIGYAPHGPLVDWDDHEQLDVLFNQIDHAVYSHRAGLVKIEPLVWRSAMPAADWATTGERHGLTVTDDTIQPPHTIWVDLRDDEDTILARMKQKTRYNIRLAERKDVVVREGGPDDIARFAQMMQVTGTRNEFGVHAADYYNAAYEIFRPYGAAALFIAEYNGRPLAAVMAFRWGRVGYNLFSASTDEERQRMPSYAVQWAAMRWARDNGCAYWDMWGVPDVDEATLEETFRSRTDGLWGVYRFKRGWGGELRRTVGAADRVYNNLVYRLYQRRRGAGA